MALEHVTGTQLQTGMPLAVAGIEGQSGQMSAGGELRTYRDHEGAICSLYAVDEDEKDITFEGLMKKSDYADKDKGDTITITGVTLPTGGVCIVDTWEEVYQNDEVVKVRGTAHVYVVTSSSNS